MRCNHSSALAVPPRLAGKIRPNQKMKSQKLFSRARLALLASIVAPVALLADPDAHVYTSSNAVVGNRIMVFDRAENGRLSLANSFPTGGKGTGAGLGSQSAITISSKGDWLLAVNAGSDELSVFSVTRDALILTDVVSSGGKHPISVTIDHNLVYVLNNGGAVGSQDNLAGFFLGADGTLKAIPNSTRALSSPNVGPAQVAFTSSGYAVVVTEKNTGLIDSYSVDDNGLLGNIVVTLSSGVTPFGFAAGPRDRIYVSEAFGGIAGQSAVSSYQVLDNAHLSVISPSVSTLQTSACWVSLARDARFAYASNTGSNSLTGYEISSDGKLRRLRADGFSAHTGKAPADSAVTADDRYIYCLNGGDGSISGFAIAHDGGLSLVETQSGIPIGAAGLAAR